MNHDWYKIQPGVSFEENRVFCRDKIVCGFSAKEAQTFCFGTLFKFTCTM